MKEGYSAKQIPKVMPHIGTIWQPESYDRIVRNQQEFENTWEYIRQNPVKAGLATTPEEYTFFWQGQARFSSRDRQDAYPYKQNPIHP
jgi:hypothetical protein